MARQRPKAVTLTEAAADRVKRLMADRDAGYLRVGVKNGGCAGMEYVMDYATAPEPLQPELDRLAARFEHGRCFVRPSGTEDVVRVYAEASTQAAADELALLVTQATWRLAGGVGEMPASVV